jgi:hypothetical protein
VTQASEHAPGQLSAGPLVAAASAKAGLVWVGEPGARPRPLWHAWHDDAVAVVVGGDEQPDPVPNGADRVHVRVPSKDNRGRLVTFEATVERVHPGDERWEAVTFALKAGRLNAPDADRIVERWAATSRVLRFVPTEHLIEQPDRYDDASGAAPPPPTPATTDSWKPFHAGGRRRRRHKPR